MERIFPKIGIGITLFLMVITLTFVNALSLIFMFHDEDIFQFVTFFAIVGAIAYSSVTVLIMRRSRVAWLKIVFPVYDAILMFCGFNLRHADNILDNPIRFAMSIFLSTFSGLITYSLGQMSAKKQEVTQSDLDKLQSQLNVTQSQLNQQAKELEFYKAFYLKYERVRINKKLPENRTPEEIEIISKVA